MESATRRIRLRMLALAIATICAVTACTAAPGPGTTPASPSTATTTPTLHTLVDAELPPTTLELGAVTQRTEAFTTTTVTYTSDGKTATGALSLPVGPGPHPGVVLVHGAVDPDVYLPGSGLIREQVHFAEAGYIVLSIDLRSAAAEMDSAAALGIDLGSTLDVINGVRALKSTHLPTLDERRIGLVGHSLGGLLSLNTIVVEPTLVDATVTIAPASIHPADNVDYLTSTFGGTPAAIVQRYGTPTENPQFWSDISPRGLVDRVEVPLLILHGTADRVIPYQWSEETAAVWQDAGKQVDLVPLEGEGHVIQARWHEAMTLATEFLTTELGG